MHEIRRALGIVAVAGAYMDGPNVRHKVVSVQTSTPNAVVSRGFAAPSRASRRGIFAGGMSGDLSHGL
jgi:hypothetical protein